MNGLKSESNQNEGNKSHLLLKPNKPNSNKILRLGSPNGNTTRELNKSTERGESTVTLRKKKQRGNLTDRSNNPTSACDFTELTALSARNEALVG